MRWQISKRSRQASGKDVFLPYARNTDAAGCVRPKADTPIIRLPPSVIF